MTEEKSNIWEPEYISINVLQDLKLEGIGQIRCTIIKDGANGKWKSISCKKLKNKEKGVSNWHMNISELIEGLKNNKISFRHATTSEKLLSKLKNLYPKYFDKSTEESTNKNKINEDENTKKRKNRDENLNEDIKKIKKSNYPQDCKNEKENLFIDFIDNIQKKKEDKNQDNTKNFEEFQKWFTIMEEKLISFDEKFLEIKNILIQNQKISN
jgi:hypothetical protein